MNEISNVRKVRRSTQERMIAGVCGGISDYVPVDPNLIRLAFVIGSFFGGAGLFVYVAAWVLIPAQGALASPAGRMVNQNRRS